MILFIVRRQKKRVETHSKLTEIGSGAIPQTSCIYRDKITANKCAPDSRLTSISINKLVSISIYQFKIPVDIADFKRRKEKKFPLSVPICVRLSCWNFWYESKSYVVLISTNFHKRWDKQNIVDLITHVTKYRSFSWWNFSMNRILLELFFLLANRSRQNVNNLYVPSVPFLVDKHFFLSLLFILSFRTKNTTLVIIVKSEFCAMLHGSSPYLYNLWK